jgi:hypothetical protein
MSDGARQETERARTAAAAGVADALGALVDFAAFDFTGLGAATFVVFAFGAAFGFGVAFGFGAALTFGALTFAILRRVSGSASSSSSSSAGSLTSASSSSASSTGSTVSDPVNAAESEGDVEGSTAADWDRRQIA